MLPNWSLLLKLLVVGAPICGKKEEEEAKGVMSVGDNIRIIWNFVPSRAHYYWINTFHIKK